MKLQKLAADLFARRKDDRDQFDADQDWRRETGCLARAQTLASCTTSDLLKREARVIAGLTQLCLIVEAKKDGNNDES